MCFHLDCTCFSALFTVFIKMQIQSIFMSAYIHIDTHRCCQNTEAERQKWGNIDSNLLLCITGVYERKSI